MKISNRLKSIAGLITEKDVIADIGCDHAYLDIYLVKNKIVPKAYVSDVNLNALNNGIKNIKKNHLECEIEAKLCDGIKGIPEDVNTLIISGMGSSTIIKILSNPKLKQINKMIIQSNNDYYILRKYITSKGYFISHESAIYDNGNYYINIVFLKGYKKYNLKELTYGPILMYSNKNYFEYLYNKQKQILDNIPKYKAYTRLQMKRKALYLKKLSK